MVSRLKYECSLFASTEISKYNYNERSLLGIQSNILQHVSIIYESIGKTELLILSEPFN